MLDQNPTTQTPPTSQEPPTPTGGGSGGPVTFTEAQQAEINRIVGDRAQRAEQTGINKLLESLGVKSLDELKTTFASAKQIADAQKTELQKAQDAANAANAKVADAERKANEATARSTERLMKAAVIAEALKTIDESELNSVWMALKEDKSLWATIKLKADSDDFDGIVEAVKKIADAHPRWLKSAVPAPRDLNSQNSGRGGKGVTAQELLERKRQEYGGARL